MKCLVLTFLSTAAVCAVLSGSPVAAQDTVTGAPAGTAPVTVDGYGNYSESTGQRAGPAPIVVEGYRNPPGHTGAPATNSDRTQAIDPPERCHDYHDFNDAEAKITVVCSR
jgi:hypothetical protein